MRDGSAPSGRAHRDARDQAVASLFERAPASVVAIGGLTGVVVVLGLVFGETAREALYLNPRALKLQHLLTFAFTHTDPFHFVWNMMLAAAFLPGLERRLGLPMLGSVYLGAGVLGAIVYFGFASFIGPGALGAGAGVSISALVGAYICLYLREDDTEWASAGEGSAEARFGLPPYNLPIWLGAMVVLNIVFVFLPIAPRFTPALALTHALALLGGTGLASLVMKGIKPMKEAFANRPDTKAEQAAVREKLQTEVKLSELAGDVWDEPEPEAKPAIRFGSRSRGTKAIATLTGAGKGEQAYRRYHEMVAEYPNTRIDLVVLWEMARQMIEKGLTNEPREVLKHIIAQHPNGFCSVKARFELGMIYSIKLEYHPHAIAYLQEAVSAEAMERASALAEPPEGLSNEERDRALDTLEGLGAGAEQAHETIRMPAADAEAGTAGPPREATEEDDVEGQENEDPRTAQFPIEAVEAAEGTAKLGLVEEAEDVGGVEFLVAGGPESDEKEELMSGESPKSDRKAGEGSGPARKGKGESLGGLFDNLEERVTSDFDLIDDSSVRNAPDNPYAAIEGPASQTPTDTMAGKANTGFFRAPDFDGLEEEESKEASRVEIKELTELPPLRIDMTGGEDTSGGEEAREPTGGRPHSFGEGIGAAEAPVAAEPPQSEDELLRFRLPSAMDNEPEIVDPAPSPPPTDAYGETKTSRPSEGEMPAIPVSDIARAPQAPAARSAEPEPDEADRERTVSPSFQRAGNLSIRVESAQIKIDRASITDGPEKTRVSKSRTKTESGSVEPEEETPAKRERLVARPSERKKEEEKAPDPTAPRKDRSSRLPAPRGAVAGGDLDQSTESEDGADVIRFARSDEAETQLWRKHYSQDRRPRYRADLRYSVILSPACPIHLDRIVGALAEALGLSREGVIHSLKRHHGILTTDMGRDDAVGMAKRLSIQGQDVTLVEHDERLDFQGPFDVLNVQLDARRPRLVTAEQVVERKWSRLVGVNCGVIGRGPGKTVMDLYFGTPAVHLRLWLNTLKPAELPGGPAPSDAVAFKRLADEISLHATFAIRSRTFIEWLRDEQTLPSAKFSSLIEYDNNSQWYLMAHYARAKFFPADTPA